MRPFDGTWEVDEAGTVTFVADRTGVRLLAVDPRAGWRPAVAEHGPERVRVTLQHDLETRRFAVTRIDDRLAVAVIATRPDAPPGRYSVGHAGEVELARDGRDLLLIELAAHPGWSVSLQRHDPVGVAVAFSTAGFDRRFLAHLTPDGRLHITTALRCGATAETAPAATLATLQGKATAHGGSGHGR